MGRRTKSAPVVERLRAFVEDYVTKPSTLYNDMPACPFAKGAFTSGSVICHLSDSLQFVDVVKQSDPTEGLSHVIFVPVEYSPVDTFDEFIASHNKNTFGHWTMGYHPKAELRAPLWQHYEEDDHVLILVQSLHELVEASAQIAANGYYDKAKTWQIEEIIDRQGASHDWQQIEARIYKQAEPEIH